MIKINDRYYIKTDSMQYILCEKVIVQDEKSKNYGKERYDNVAYYGNIESLKAGLIEKELKENIQSLENIDKIIEIKNELMNMSK